MFFCYLDFQLSDGRTELPINAELRFDPIFSCFGFSVNVANVTLDARVAAAQDRKGLKALSLFFSELCSFQFDLISLASNRGLLPTVMVPLKCTIYQTKSG